MFVADLHTTSLAARDAATSYILSRGESIGLTLDTEAGLLSAVAASVVLIVVFYRRSPPNPNYNLMDSYVISLFTAEVIQGVGHAMDMKWVIEGKLSTSTFCTAQGAIQQLGETGVTLTTLVIAIHTFRNSTSGDGETREDEFYPPLFVGLLWLFVILFVAIGFAVHTHADREYYATPTPYWCWIGQGFKPERIAGEYVWFWLTLFGSIVLYALIYIYYESTGTRFKDQKRMIAYPIAYCVMILPLSVVRWITFRQQDQDGHSHIHPLATFFVEVIFSLSGIWNAALYALTRAPLLCGRSKGGVSMDNGSSQGDRTVPTSDPPDPPA